MDYDRIIALDLGKFKTVACVTDAASRTHAFETIEMSPANVHDLVVRHVTDSSAADTLVAFEACDCAGWVHDVAAALGTPVIVVTSSDPGIYPVGCGVEALVEATGESKMKPQSNITYSFDVALIWLIWRGMPLAGRMAMAFAP
jgi:hypothetical protein